MNKNKTLSLAILLAGITLSGQVYAQQWPQGEQAYMPSTQSPQWVDSQPNNMPPQNMPNRNMMAPQAMPYQQAPMPYPAPNYGYAPPQNMQQYQPNFAQPRFAPPRQPFMPPQYGQMMPQQPPFQGNTGWGSWPNNNTNGFMPGMPNMGNWNMPNMNMGNWSMPEMPEMGNMPGMPNMDNFEMPSPSFEMPSPSFTTPNMPFNQW